MDVKPIILIGDNFDIPESYTDEEAQAEIDRHLFVAVNPNMEHGGSVVVNVYDQQMLLNHEEAFKLSLMMSQYVLHSPYSDQVKPYYDEVSKVLTRKPSNSRLN